MEKYHNVVPPFFGRQFRPTTNTLLSISFRDKRSVRTRGTPTEIELTWRVNVSSVSGIAFLHGGHA